MTPHDQITEHGKPPMIPGSINTSNVQSAGNRKSQQKAVDRNPNFIQHSTGEEISPLVGESKANTMIANDSMVQAIEGLEGEIRNGSPNNEE